MKTADTQWIPQTQGKQKRIVTVSSKEKIQAMQQGSYVTGGDSMTGVPHTQLLLRRTEKVPVAPPSQQHAHVTMSANILQQQSRRGKLRTGTGRRKGDAGAKTISASAASTTLTF